MAVAVSIDGAQPFSISYRENTFNSYVPRGGSSQTSVIFFFVDIGVQTQASSQGTNYARSFTGGSLRRIRLLTIILPVVPTTRKHLSGFSVGVSSPNGSPMPHFCGSTENVRSPDLSSATDADAPLL